MKTFDSLTKEQQTEAINFALQELEDVIKEGIVIPERPLTKEEKLELATTAAEESVYTESGRIINDEVIPYFFQGGCV